MSCFFITIKSLKFFLFFSYNPKVTEALVRRTVHMSSLSMENLLLRMKRFTSGTAVSFVLLSSLVACSSRHGAVDSAISEEVSARDSQEDASLVLGDASADTSSQDNLEATSDQASGSDVMNSLPVKNSTFRHRAKLHKSDRQAVKIWRGQLHTQYTSDMKEWKVARGESLSLIADGVFGKANSLKKLLDLNPEIEDPNVLMVGQILRLPVSEESAQVADLSKVSPQKEEDRVVVAQPAPQKEIPAVDAGLSVVSNAPSQGASLSIDTGSNSVDAQVGAMATVPVASAPSVATSADQSSVDSSVVEPKSQDSAGSSPIVQKVSNVSKKSNVRTMLLVGAVGFLIMSAVVFILGRKKA